MNIETFPLAILILLSLLVLLSVFSKVIVVKEVFKKDESGGAVWSVVSAVFLVTISVVIDTLFLGILIGLFL